MAKRQRFPQHSSPHAKKVTPSDDPAPSEADIKNGFISPRHTAALTSLSPVTIWRLEGRNEFPKRVRISRGRVAYLRSQVEQWLRDRLMQA
jgi:prophage regulatory protein